MRKVVVFLATLLACAFLMSGCGGTQKHIWLTHSKHSFSACAGTQCDTIPVTVHWDVTIANVTGYYVFLNGNQVASVTSKSYTYTGLNCGFVTYNLGVEAHDGSGHVSQLYTTPYTTPSCSGGSPPANSSLPTISGTDQNGSTLTATDGTWTNSPISYAYQWEDCDASGANCTSIPGATSATYVLQGTDVGSTIVVKVTASNVAGSTSASSAPTSTVTSGSSGGGPINTSTPVVTGNTVVGGTLTTDNGSWSTTPTSYSYQWQRCIGQSCTSISGATSSTYKVQSADVGYSLSADVTATGTGGTTSVNSYNTGYALPTTISSSQFVDVAYLLPWEVPTGCTSLDATCLTSTSAPNWGGINESIIFAMLQNDPSTVATSTSDVKLGQTITSIPANVTSAIAAGPIMITTNATTPSSGNYQILQTSGAASGATSIPITGSPLAQSAFPSGSSIMTETLNYSTLSMPSGSNMTNLVAAIHSEGSTVLGSVGGSNDLTWHTDCVNGFQYLLGAEMASYMTQYNLDGMEIDQEDGSMSNAQASACSSAIGQSLHAVATAANKVPIVYDDFNPTDTSETQPANAITNLDQVNFEYYGYNPNTQYNCSNNCQEEAQFLSEGIAAGIPSQKWLGLQGVVGGYAQSASTVLGTITASASGNVTSIPISGAAAAGSVAAGTIPAGVVILATTGTPPSNYEILETSGVTGCTSGCNLPITGYCQVSGWQPGTGNCHNSGTGVTLNATYPSGSDVYLSALGYPYSGPGSSGYNVGGWDCGNNAAYAAAHNMAGVGEWFWNGSPNTALCFDTIAPFISGGFGLKHPSQPAIKPRHNSPVSIRS